MDLKQRIEQSWEANADAWAVAVRTGAIPSRIAGTNAAILDALGPTRPCRVLDVGCGEGWLAKELADDGCDVVGFDGSSRLIAQAPDLSAIRFLTLSYADFIRDPSQIPGTFDRVICNYSLFEEDLRSLLGLLHAKLSEGGLLIVQTLHPFKMISSGQPYESGWHTETFESLGEQFRSSMPYFFRTFAGWCDEIRYAGFTINRCIEPCPPPASQPLSLILIAERGAVND